MSNGSSIAFRAVGIAAFALITLSSVSAQPVFPGAVGFGSDTPAGRNGGVVRVRSLADSGPDTLRAALTLSECPTAQVVIFDVSGIIHLQTHLKIRCPNTTVAGQTAPAPGIMIEGADLQIAASNVLVQHIHSRVGKEHPLTPALNSRSGIAVDGGCCAPVISHVVVDHVSIAWAPDQSFLTWSTNGTIRNVTLSNSLMAEGLRYSCPYGTSDEDLPAWNYCHPDYKSNYDEHNNIPPASEQDGHSTGPLIGENSANVSLIRNISAFNRSRNPMVADKTNNVQVANNFNYWGRYDAHTQLLTKPRDASDSTSTVRGNVYIHEPNLDSSENSQAITAKPANDGIIRLFVADNRLYNHNVDNLGAPLGPPFWTPAANESPWLLVREGLTGLPTDPGSGPVVEELLSEPSQFTALGVPLLNPDRVEMVVTSTAGARSAYRDSVDQRILEDIASRVRNRGYGTDGGYVSDPGETGGYPNWQPVVRSPPIVTPASGNSDGDAYTDMDEWLHTLAWQLEGDQRIARFDTFEDGELKDPNVNDGNWVGWFADSELSTWSVVTDGATKVLNQSAISGGRHLLLSRTWFYDQVIEAKVKPTAFEPSSPTGRFVRVVARYRDPANSYYVTLRSPNIVEIKKIVANTSQTLATTTVSAITPNDWYSVRFSLANGPGTSATTVLSAKVTNLTTSETVTLGPVSDSNPLPPGFVAVGTNFATARFDDVFVSPVSTTAAPQLTEDFDDGNSTGWTDNGGNWTVQLSSGTHVRRQSSSTASLLARSSWDTAVGGADQSVQATVKVLTFPATSTPSFVSVHARYVDSLNNYNVTLRNTGIFELKKIVNGVTVPTMVRQATLPASFKLTNAPHTLRIDVSGTTEPVLTGYLDGVPLLTLTDNSGSPYAAAGKAAIGTFGATAEFDNVVVATPP